MAFCVPYQTIAQSKKQLSDSILPIRIPVAATCKLRDDAFFYPYGNTVLTQQKAANRANRQTERKALLKISGNILYDMNYRSRIDTPYADREVYQHTIQTRIDILYKDQYPLKLYTTKRFSNSPLFRSYTDMNLQFNAQDFVQSIKRKAIQSVEQAILKNFTQLDSLRTLLDSRKEKIITHKRAMDIGSLDDRILQERERLYYQHKKAADMHVDLDPSISLPSIDLPSASKFLKQPDKPSVSTDSSMLTRLERETTKRKQDLDSLIQDYHQLESTYKMLSLEQQSNIQALQRQLGNSTGIDSLGNIIKQNNLPDSLLPKHYKLLASVRNFSIGRSIADYSELTVKNISITGLQIELNPRYYYAVAVGKVDYRFRDYIVPNRLQSKQYLALARVGKGLRNGNHVYFSYYTGKRQLFNSMVTTQPGNEQPAYNLAGISIEGFWRINRHFSAVGEVAKSTVPFYGRDSLAKSNWMNALTDFNTRQNEAYSLRVNGFIPSTQTKLTGSVRYFGSHFQSFSSFTTGSAQLRWMMKAEQPFFKRKLTILSSVQQNEFNNPFVTAHYKSSALIGSFQANLRIKKWPVISAGYYPSYQLVKTGEDQFAESRYHTLSGSVGYHYQWGGKQLSSFLVYSQFYNNSNDSGFIFYNSRNLLLTQTIQFSRWNYTLQLASNASSENQIYSIENLAQWTISERLSAGGGIKSIKQSGLSSIYLGYSGNLSFQLPKIGELQVSFDKGYLPGLVRNLVENKIGRVTYYKIF